MRINGYLIIKQADSRNIHMLPPYELPGASHTGAADAVAHKLTKDLFRCEGKHRAL